MMENTEYENVIGSSAAPYINSLARRYGLATRFFGIQHPSLPNYLALLGGSTFGIQDNCDDCSIQGPSLVDQLEKAGISWRAYMEGLPSPCSQTTSDGEYTKHHNPFVYFDDIVSNAGRCAKVVPFTRLGSDLRRGALPRFVWITPDECHDMHDCSVAVADRFLKRQLPPVLRALGRRGVLFLAWDEGTSDRGCCSGSNGGHIAMIAAGGLVRHGARFRRPANQYSILKTIEGLWGLPKLRRARSASVPSLSSLLRKP
jgi:phosphatidylinositol-3-phosphatase